MTIIRDNRSHKYLSCVMLAGLRQNSASLIKHCLYKYKSLDDDLNQSRCIHNANCVHILTMLSCHVNSIIPSVVVFLSTVIALS